MLKIDISRSIYGMELTVQYCRKVCGKVNHCDFHPKVIEIEVELQLGVLFEFAKRINGTSGKFYVSKNFCRNFADGRNMAQK